MQEDKIDAHWMDESEDGFKSCLTCHIEIDNEGGDTPREVATSTAKALRALAAQIEAGTLDDGHHPINLLDGKEIGKVYIDWYASGPL